MIKKIIRYRISPIVSEVMQVEYSRFYLMY